MSFVLKNTKFEKRRYVVIISILLAVLCCSAIVLCLAYVSHIDSLLTDNVELALNENNNFLSSIIDNRVKQVAESLNVLSYVISVSPDLLSEFNLNLISHEKEILGLTRLSIALPDGFYISHDGSEINISDRQYFADSMNGNVGISDIFKSRITGKNVLAISVPIIKNNEIVGVLVGIHSEEDLQAYLASSLANVQGVAFVTIGNGKGSSVIFDSKIKFSTELDVVEVLPNISTLNDEILNTQDILNNRKAGAGILYIDGKPW